MEGTELLLLLMRSALPASHAGFYPQAASLPHSWWAGCLRSTWSPLAWKCFPQELCWPCFGQCLPPDSFRPGCNSRSSLLPLATYFMKGSPFPSSFSFCWDLLPSLHKICIQDSLVSSLGFFKIILTMFRNIVFQNKILLAFFSLIKLLAIQKHWKK